MTADPSKSYQTLIRKQLRVNETWRECVERLVADSAALANVRREVEAAADYAQITLDGMEKERNAAVEEAQILRSERDQARIQRDGVTEALHLVSKELTTTAELLEEQVKLAEQATAARKLFAKETDARLATLSHQVEDAATHGRMVGGLVGLVVGVVVTGLLAAAL